MGGFSLWHWIIVLVVVGVPLAIIGVVVFLLANKRPAPAAATTHKPANSSVESRLQHITELREKLVITDAEYQQQRAEILKSV